jgi:curved DNA-binding protein CbpA
MATERRNLYRILHVQPEAPAEVIKAAYRALMSTLRAHPDLGGDHEQAARLNAAYAVLSDPVQRRAYDRSLRKPARQVGHGAAAPAPSAPSAVADPQAWLARRCCPFCAHPFAGKPGPQDRCGRCDSPLGAAPATERGGGELLGRRRGERYARELDARLRLPGDRSDRTARLRDLSLTGLSLVCLQRLAEGTPFRLTTPSFDTVATVVACRSSGAAYTVHARLLTLQMVRTGRGVFVSATA